MALDNTANTVVETVEVSTGGADGELPQFFERLERLEEEKKEVADQIKEVWAEFKARGFNVACGKKILAERKRDKDDLAEEQSIMEMYRAALGM